MEKIKVHVTRRKRKRGYVYAVEWQDPRAGQRKTETVGKDKAYAQTIASERRQMLQNGQTAGITPITYDAFVTEHLIQIESQLSPASYGIHERTLRQFMGICSPKSVAVIDFQMLEKFRTARIKAGVSPATLNKDLRTLQSILERAVMRNYIRTNPFKGKRKALMVKESEPVPRILEPEDFAAMLGACRDDRWRAMCTVAYYGGLRRGEMLALDWKDVDFENQILHVRNTEDHVAKSRKNRDVPMTSDVVRALSALKSGRLPTGSVFRNAAGVRMTRNICWSFGEIVRRAGLVDDKGKARFSMHDLRRSCATELLRHGVSPKTVQKILGHANLTTTMTYYAGVTDKDLRNAMKLLESRMA